MVNRKSFSNRARAPRQASTQISRGSEIAAQHGSSPNAGELILTRHPGKTDEETIANAALGPTVNAGLTIKRITARDGTWNNANASVTALVQELGAQNSAVKCGDLGRAEEMLLAQAHTLDALFHSMVARSLANSEAGNLDGSETYMRLALRAQSQSRATLETLSVVKNPPSVAFVRQANIANGPQQVNNGHGPAPSGPVARAGENSNSRSKLLEQQNGERLDPGAAQASVGPHPQLASVGALNGSADA